MDLWRRGEKVSLNDRKSCIELVAEAQEAGAKKSAACALLGLSVRTLQRWEKNSGLGDQRRGPKTAPQNSLTKQEKKKMLKIANSKKYRDLNPHKIVATLADSGEYIASESSFYRLLRSEKLLSHRSKSKPRRNHPPRCLVATKPNQVWSWDITYLSTHIKGVYFYLYLVEDIFSRMIVGWCVEERECSERAANLVERSCIEQSIERNQIHLHSDNGAAMKGATMLSTLSRLGVIPSFSRPSVSDDNPFSESLFKTMKYCPQYPDKGFAAIEEARIWASNFVAWYTKQHLHSEIRFVTPYARHYGLEKEILTKRDSLYKNAKNKTPLRWTKTTRNWSPIEKVVLNPGKEEKQPNFPLLNQST